jgi:hypothetical protein
VEVKILRCAQYDESGKIVNLSDFGITAVSPSDFNSISGTAPLAKGAYTAKAFLWDADTFILLHLNV